ncbi:hypothetical protein DMC30DRAFT_397696 [Rhodotorula diobovata]|uniref:Insulin-like growth factor binding protein n=1 Tax=Rhodotorula diobovata TaxID=5288 RepID=A0A5C5FWA5_9BASI|nr:hypothetical protein DMC30DRAFT_397696 [Rhodotorula diobovata]
MRATCVKCNGFEEFDPVSQECFCPSGTYKTDVVGCARCTDFGSLVKTCTDAGPVECNLGAQLYQGTCVDGCPMGTLPSDSTCRTCSELPGNTCDLVTAHACNLLLDETTDTCAISCRAMSDGISLPATYQQGSVCKSCGIVGIDECTASGPTGCRSPYGLLSSPDLATTQCVLRSDCIASPQNIYRSEVSEDLRYNVGFCQTCPASSRPDPVDRRQCVLNP